MQRSVIRGCVTSNIPDFIAFHPGYAGLPDRVAHAGHGKQEQRFLHGLPVFGGKEHRAVLLAGNEDGLVRLGGLVNQAVEICARLACGESGHDALRVDR
jgi:hypothetical protein